MPGWKGSGEQKPIDKTDSEPGLEMVPIPGQKILDLFYRGFQSTHEQGNKLETQVQAVKGALYDRDYERAFGTQENLDAYVVRWSPSRALGYSALMQSLEPIKTLFQTQPDVKALTIGGGAGAEVVALGSIALLNENEPVRIKVTAVDVAEWGGVLDKIVHYIAGNWYKQAASLEDALTQMSLDEAKFSVKFINHDILSLSPDTYNLETLDLITSMFTTNELFALSKAGTVRFLRSLSACKKGTLLLLVESAGSYSQIQVGTKTFPVQFLIDHSLTSEGHWKLLEGSDSKWYRVPSNIYYNLKLENMRFFFRLYERQ